MGSKLYSLVFLAFGLIGVIFGLIALDMDTLSYNDVIICKISITLGAIGVILHGRKLINGSDEESKKE